MRLMKLFLTEELEEYVEKKLKKLKDTGYDIKEKIIYSKNTQVSPEGTYVFSDHQGYHYVYSERGTENTHKITDDLFEISYWILSSIVSSLSFEYAAKNREEGKSYRQVAFVKKIEIMNIIGKNYKKREEIEIDEILKEYPE